MRSIAGGGPADMRCVLSRAALAAAKHNPVLRAFKGRLARAGKKARATLTVAARELVVRANAALKSRRPWDRALASPC